MAVFLDDGDLEAELRGTNGTDIAAGAAADDREIVSSHDGMRSFWSEFPLGEQIAPARWRDPQPRSRLALHGAIGDLEIEHQPLRVLEAFPDADQEGHGVLTVDDTMVVG